MKKSLLLLFFTICSFSILISQEEKIWEHEAKAFSHKNSLAKLNYPGDANIDVTYYKLDLAVTPPKNISGNVTVSAKVLSQGLLGIILDFTTQLIVDSVKIGNTVLPFTQTISQVYGTDILQTNLDRPYNVGESFTMVISYHGVPTKGLYSTTHNNVPVMYTLSEPYDAMNWYPCKDTPADKADSSDVWITVDTAFTPVSNGKLTSVLNNNNGTHTYKWKNSYPIAQYLISLAITNYTLYTNYYKYSPTDSMAITNYVYPETFNVMVQEDFHKVSQMLTVFSNKFGQYPFIQEKYGHAQWENNFNLEHQTISSIRIFPGASHELTFSHELAHQWFGDKVTCKDWHHIWLSEGFATYCEFIWKNTQYGTSFNFSPSAKTARGSIYVQNITDVNEIFNYGRTYAKGAAVLHMLRGIVGDATFFTILQTYLNHPSLAYNVATTEDFQSVAENIYGSSLYYFFREWIYGENYPKYSMTWASKSVITSRNKYYLSVNISQATNTFPTFFTMPIQLKISRASGIDTLVTVFNDQQNQSFVFVLNSPPTNVVLDPNNYILKDVLPVSIGPAPKNSGNTTPTSYEVSQNFPNPFNPQTTITYQLPTKNYVTLKVYDMLGKEAATLVDGETDAGVYQVNFDASKFSTGLYFYKFTADNFTEIKKMMLVK